MYPPCQTRVKRQCYSCMVASSMGLCLSGNREINMTLMMVMTITPCIQTCAQQAVTSWHRYNYCTSASYSCVGGLSLPSPGSTAMLQVPSRLWKTEVSAMSGGPPSRDKEEEDDRERHGWIMSKLGLDWHWRKQYEQQLKKKKKKKKFIVHRKTNDTNSDVTAST